MLAAPTAGALLPIFEAVMRHTLTPFIALFASVALLLTGGGMLTTLIGVRMSEEAFPLGVIGVITALSSPHWCVQGSFHA
jgi:hypothetical protein